MIYLFSAMAGVIAVELFIYLPLAANAKCMLKMSHRAVTVIRSKKISDHWKEKIMLSYAQAVAVNSVMLAIYFIIVAVSVYSFLLFADMVMVGDSIVQDFFFSSQGLLLVSVISMAYFFVRVRCVRRL